MHISLPFLVIYLIAKHGRDFRLRFSSKKPLFETRQKIVFFGSEFLGLGPRICSVDARRVTPLLLLLVYIQYIHMGLLRAESYGLAWKTTKLSGVDGHEELKPSRPRAAAVRSPIEYHHHQLSSRETFDRSIISGASYWPVSLGPGSIRLLFYATCFYARWSLWLHYFISTA